MSNADQQSQIDSLARAVAKALGERKQRPYRQIRRVIKQYGAARALEWLARAQQIEAAGGMLTRTGRRRTLGGVFFRLIKESMGRRAYRYVFRSKPPHTLRWQPLPAFVWEQRSTLLAGLLTQKGALESVKVILIGRPGAIASYKDCVVTALEPTRSPSLPRGLPTVPPTPTPHVVYINRRHWTAVAPQLIDPDQVLVVEGWATFDPQLAGLAVFALKVHTQLSQSAKNRQQKRGTA